MTDYEHARASLERLIQEESAVADDANEATVRFRLIDALVTEVLGWGRTGVEVERHERGDYTDYECGNPRVLIIEAKRASTHFILPAGFNKKLCRIKTLCEASADVENAVTQAIRYCRERSVPYGAVCNGRQLVFFVGARTDAVESLSGRAVIFRSLSEMLDRFNELWGLGSPPGIAEGNLGRLLKGTNLPPPPLKLSARIPGYPGHKNRNPIATELQILGGAFY